MTEQPAPYSGTPTPDATPPVRPKQVRIGHLQDWKTSGHNWTMLTAYDCMTAAIFDQAGVPVLLVGDSAANTVLGHRTTLAITSDEMLILGKAVVRGAQSALVVMDLPFGSYQVNPEQAVATAMHFMKETGAHAVKFEGGELMAPSIARVVAAGVPVVAHIGFTPQSEHALGGYRVQGRGAGAEQLLRDAHAVAEAGACAVILEMVPAALAAQVTAELPIPTVGIGAGPNCDAQVLVWQDMLGLGTGRTARFVKQYANLHQVITTAVTQFNSEVAAGQFPAAEHSFDD